MKGGRTTKNTQRAQVVGSEKADSLENDERQIEQEVPSRGRRRFNQAVYTAPAIVFLGTLSGLAQGQTVQSCDPAIEPLGCPPDPP